MIFFLLKQFIYIHIYIYIYIYIYILNIYIFVPQVMLKTAIQKYLSSTDHVQN